MTLKRSGVRFGGEDAGADGGVYFFSLFFVLFFGQVQRRWSRAESGQPLGEVQRRGEERRGEKEGRQTVYQEFPPASAGSLPHQLAVHASPLPPRVPAAIPQRLPPPVIGQVGASPSESCLSLRTSCLTRNSWTLITAD